jgi:hypothetical protein
MADKTEAAAPNFEIEMYKPDEDGKPYRAHVQALVAADAARTAEQIAAGEHASIKVTFPKEEDGKKAIERHKRWFRESAAPELSAKVVGEVDKGESIEFRYIVVPKIVRPRKAEDEQAPADADESTETDADESTETDAGKKATPKAA